MADQEAELSRTAALLRTDLDALSALVPSPRESFAPEDGEMDCRVGGDDDGSKQWVYAPRFFYPGPGAAVVEQAAAELERRGYVVGQRAASDRESSFTAVKDGAAVTVRDGPLPSDPASAVVFVGYGPCVAADGTVSTRNPQ